jgi:GNAT superfamily N-acetyltransferase
MIRRGNEGDIAKLGRLWLEMVRELSNAQPMLEWWKIIELDSLRNNKEYYCFVAEEGGKIVGFIDFIMVVEPSISKCQAIGRHYYVMPAYRKKRIPLQLFDAAIQEIKDKGAKSISFSCFPEKVDFWKKRGFNQYQVVMTASI